MKWVVGAIVVVSVAAAVVRSRRNVKVAPRSSWTRATDAATSAASAAANGVRGAVLHH